MILLPAPTLRRLTLGRLCPPLPLPRNRIGPLHNREHLEQMLDAAARVTPPPPARTLAALAALIAEARPALDAYPLSVGLGDLSRRAGVAALPPRAVLVAALARRGYVAVPAAAGDKALKTDAPVAVLVAVVREEAARASAAAAAAAGDAAVKAAAGDGAMATGAAGSPAGQATGGAAAGATAAVPERKGGGGGGAVPTAGCVGRR